MTAGPAAGSLHTDEGVERLLTGWGHTAPTRALVIPARDAERVRAALTSGGDRGCLARGLARSYGDAAQNAGGTVIDATALAGVRALDAEQGLIAVGAGTSLDELIRRVVPLGWFPAVTPGTRAVTVGGAIASDVHGKNHHRDGGFAAHVPAFQLVTPALGTMTVTREETPDAFLATAGGMGLTGVVAEATLRLLPIETSRMRVDTVRTSELDATMSALASADRTARYSVAWLDCLAGGRRLGRGIVTSGDHATLEELGGRAREEPLTFDARSLAAVPFGAPRGTLGPAVARVFNEAWFRWAPASEHGRLRTLASFFHPLDGIANWNRLYGSRGFVQYQFAVPFGRSDVVRSALERLSAARCPSFLAVLKRFGKPGGLLSFPIPGWTLALDVPAAAPGLPRVLDELDQEVAEAGGRVYLAKDARLRPELLPVMYPELDRWREARERLDPGHVLRSDLDRRLGLTGGGGRAA